jgi:hypothetical protein
MSFFRDDDFHYPTPPHRYPLTRRPPDRDHELLQRLQELERQRAQLNQTQAAITTLLRDPELAERWRKFSKGGGVTAIQFEEYLAGTFRPRIFRGRGRKHLRLIAGKSTTPFKLRSDRDASREDEGPGVA